MDELSSIKRRLKEFERVLYGYNYECHFIFDKITDGLDLSEARDVIDARYKQTSRKAELKAVSYSEFVENFSSDLRYRGDRSAGVTLTSKQELGFDLKLKEFTTLIRQKFNPTKTRVLIYPELTTWIFWGFCFLIISKERNAIYLFQGISSD